MEHALKSSTSHTLGVGEAMVMSGSNFGPELVSSNLLPNDNGEMTVGCDDRKYIGVADFCAEDAVRMLESRLTSSSSTSASKHSTHQSHPLTSPAPKTCKRKQFRDQFMDIEPATIFCPAEKHPMLNGNKSSIRGRHHGRPNQQPAYSVARSTTAAQQAAMVLADYYGMDPLQIHLFAQFTGQMARSRSPQYPQAPYRGHCSQPQAFRRSRHPGQYPQQQPSQQPQQQYQVPFPHRMQTDDVEMFPQRIQPTRDTFPPGYNSVYLDHDHAHTTTGSEDEHDDEEDEEEDEVSSCGEMIPPRFTPRADLGDLLQFSPQPSSKKIACSESIMSNHFQSGSDRMEVLVDASLVDMPSSYARSEFGLDGGEIPETDERSMCVGSQPNWAAMPQTFVSQEQGFDPQNRKFTCEECGKMYKQKSHLKVHRRTHEGVRPFCCKFESCGKTFVTNSALRAHERVHSGERPYLCVIEGCGRMFSTNSNLRRHERTHSQRTGGIVATL